MWDVVFPRVIWPFQDDRPQSGKKKRKIYLFIGLNALALSNTLSHSPKHTLFTLAQKAQHALLYRVAIPFLVAFAGDLKIRRDGNKFRAGR